MEYHFILDDVKSIEKKIKVKKRPNMPSPEKDIEAVSVKGRDGDLHIDYGTYRNIVVDVECNYIDKPVNWHKKWRSIKKWLFDEHTWLSFSDDDEYMYKIANISLSTNERRIIESGEFTVSFKLEPYAYLKTGQSEVYIDDVSYNEYETSKPIYKISGAGECTVTINGCSFTITVNESFIIDTEKQISYDEEMNSLNDEILVDYEDIYLLEGENDISVSDGFTMTIVPNWREI